MTMSGISMMMNLKGLQWVNKLTMVRFAAFFRTSTISLLIEKHGSASRSRCITLSCESKHSSCRLASTELTFGGPRRLRRLDRDRMHTLCTSNSAFSFLTSWSRGNLTDEDNCGIGASQSGFTSGQKGSFRRSSTSGIDQGKIIFSALASNNEQNPR